jgi:CRP-like cAMP-binding protein
MSNYSAFLKSVNYFSFLSDAEIQLIEGVCTAETRQAGEIVFVEGATKDKFFIIYDGEVEIWKNYGKPDQILLAVFGPGRMFGELALIDDLPRSATVVTRTPVTFLTIFYEDFEKIIAEHQSVSLAVMKSIAGYIRDSTDKLTDDLRAQNRYLEDFNKRLLREVDDRHRAEDQLKEYQKQLEKAVAERTEQLEEINRHLRAEIEKRKTVEKQMEAAGGRQEKKKVSLNSCKKCKKVKDDRGRWKPLETYLQDTADFDVRSSLCPECSEEKFQKYYRK